MSQDIRPAVETQAEAGSEGTRAEQPENRGYWGYREIPEDDHGSSANQGCADGD